MPDIVACLSQKQQRAPGPSAPRSSFIRRRNTDAPDRNHCIINHTPKVARVLHERVTGKHSRELKLFL